MKLSTYMWRNLIVALYLNITLLSAAFAGNNFQVLNSRVLDTILGNGYDNRIRPNGSYHSQASGQSGPCLDRVNIYVRNIERLDDQNMEMSAQLTFRQQWNDDRLKYDDLRGSVRYVNLLNVTNIWTPDLFFSNEKRAYRHNILSPNILMRIYPNGNVLYSTRISLVLSCPMDFTNYPFDRQTCNIKMASYGLTSDDLALLWKDSDAVQITKNLHLPHFILENYQTSYCTSKTNTGEYSCLELRIQFKREFNYYLIEVYIPCTMIVIVSWIVFWLDPIDGIKTRSLFSLITLLAFASMINQINLQLPPVSYTKAIDVWTGSCLTFVFLTLLQSVVIILATGRRKTERQSLLSFFKRSRKSDIEANDSVNKQTDKSQVMSPLIASNVSETDENKAQTNNSLVYLIDMLSKIFFPIIFGLFIIIYTAVYAL